MKLKTLITGAILTLSILAASATTALAAVPRGRFEKVTDTAITGWAYNRDLPYNAITCTVAVFNKATGEEVLRQKLKMCIRDSLPPPWRTGFLLMNRWR